MYQVNEEHQMLRDLVKKFVRNELMPLEKNVLDRFASGQQASLSDDENARLFKQCKDLGLWALDEPEEIGGANLPLHPEAAQDGWRKATLNVRFPANLAAGKYHITLKLMNGHLQALLPLRHPHHARGRMQPHDLPQGEGRLRRRMQCHWPWPACCLRD